MDQVLRERTLARFEEHREAWKTNEGVRVLYREWYGLVRDRLPAQTLGPAVEIGSGPGFAKEVIPQLELSDIVRAPWHQHELDAEALPFDDASLGALTMFDVLHHLAHPTAFFREAARVLKPGGRIVMCEPYVSAFSWPVYKFIHPERLDFRVDPFDERPATGDDPFEGNQAVPTLLLVRRRAELEALFPELVVREVRPLAGLSYPTSGGFSRERPLLPLALWRTLHGAEGKLPAGAFRVIGFRLLAVMEKRERHV